MRKIVQKPLGQLLIEGRSITAAHLEEALKVQAEKGGLIGHVLVNLGYATEEAIAVALTTQYGLPYLPLVGYEIDPEVSKIIPENVARTYGLIAVDKVGMILTVVMSDPLNTKALQEVESCTGLKVQIYIGTMSDVNDAITRSYKVRA